MLSDQIKEWWFTADLMWQKHSDLHKLQMFDWQIRHKIIWNDLMPLNIYLHVQYNNTFSLKHFKTWKKRLSWTSESLNQSSKLILLNSLNWFLWNNLYYAKRYIKVKRKSIKLITYYAKELNKWIVIFSEKIFQPITDTHHSDLFLSLIVCICCVRSRVWFTNWKNKCIAWL